jgi:hypothetical protein
MDVKRIAESIADKIPGGFADKKDPEDFDPKALEKGVKVELEHTDDEDLAREIAMDHLTEFENYYDALDLMEKILERSDDPIAVLKKALEGIEGD